MGSQTFQKGDVIIEEGSLGTSAYVINSGKVEVSGLINGRKIVFATLGEKQIFGEMGLIEDKPRSATITATEPTELREISRDGFNELFGKNPKVLLPIIKALFERLRTATRMAAAKIAAAGTGDNGDNLLNDEVVEDKIIDERYIVFSGATEFAKESLDFTELEIKEFPFKVGRYTLEQRRSNDVLSDNDFFIKEDSSPYYVSRNHFLIDKMEGNLIVVDRGSRLGVMINGKRVSESAILPAQGITELIVGSGYSPFSYNMEIKGVIKRVKPDGTIEIDGEKIKTPEAEAEEIRTVTIGKNYESVDDNPIKPAIVKKKKKSK